MTLLIREDTFPNFQFVDISHKDEIEGFTKNFPPYSDFSFTSLWAYNTNSSAKFCWLNNNLVICMPDYTNSQLVFSFLGNNKTTDTVNKLIAYINENNFSAEINIVPEISVKELLLNTKIQFSIEENQDQHDYVIPLKESAELTNVHHHKVTKYQKFMELFPDHQVKLIDLSNTDSHNIILDLFMRWANQKNKNLQDIEIELTALKRVMQYHQHFELLTHGIFIDDKLVGFTIDERVHDSFVIGHFIKADMEFPGTYEVLNKITAEIHYKMGYKYINIEQDLGIPGLRLSKSQRSPVFYLKKYVIKPVTTQ